MRRLFSKQYNYSATSQRESQLWQKDATVNSDRFLLCVCVVYSGTSSRDVRRVARRRRSSVERLDGRRSVVTGRLGTRGPLAEHRGRGDDDDNGQRWRLRRRARTAQQAEAIPGDCSTVR